MLLRNLWLHFWKNDKLDLCKNTLQNINHSVASLPPGKIAPTFKCKKMLILKFFIGAISKNFHNKHV